MNRTTARTATRPSPASRPHFSRRRVQPFAPSGPFFGAAFGLFFGLVFERPPAGAFFAGSPRWPRGVGELRGEEVRGRAPATSDGRGAATITGGPIALT